MKRRTGFCPLIAALTLSIAHSGLCQLGNTLENDAVNEIISARHRNRATVIRRLDDQQRHAAQQHFVRVRQASGFSDSEVLEILLLLDEPGMVEEAIEEAKNPFGRFPALLVAEAGDARWIERLVPTVMADEPFKTLQAGDAVAMPASFQNAMLILRIAGNSPDLSQEVINWAREHHRLWLKPEDVRGLVRGWWRENEQAFRSRDFKAVKPGEDLRELSAQRREETEARRYEARKQKAQARSDGVETAYVPLAQTTAQTPPGSPSADIQKSSSWLGFAIAGGCALLLALAVWMQARRAG
jgi:hypothetical protein